MASMSRCQGVDLPVYPGLSMGDMFNAFYECARRMTAFSGNSDKLLAGLSRSRQARADKPEPLSRLVQRRFRDDLLEYRLH